MGHEWTRLVSALMSSLKYPLLSMDAMALGGFKGMDGSNSIEYSFFDIGKGVLPLPVSY